MATVLEPQPQSEEWRGWPVEAKRQLLLGLRQRLFGTWRERARPEQLPPEDEWMILLLRGGRGSGKTWAGAHILRELIEGDPIREAEGPGEWAVVAPTFGDARDKCIESAESGLLLAFDTTAGEVDAGISPTVAKWNRSIGEMYLHDGTFIQIDGADDGAYRIQGLNLRGAWCDEIGLWKKWKTAWDESLGYALRKGQARTVATGTPKRDRPARALVQRLVGDPNVVSRQLHTRDNWDNLSAAFKERVLRTAGTELGRQELHGELLEEAEGALWAREWIEAGRAKRSPAKGYRVKVLALDPSDGTEEGAEQAWCLAGLGMDQHLYVAGSEGMRTRPLPWLKQAILLAADEQATIVVEKNHGGQALCDLLEQAMKELAVRVPYVTVWASQGKLTRAEPVAMLYEQGFASGRPVIHHIGSMPELEDQQCNFTGEPGQDSPDRLDALVWALTRLMGYSRTPSKGEDAAVPYSEKRKPDGAVAWR
jgi:phage terminase large subunit-like protein